VSFHPLIDGDFYVILKMNRFSQFIKNAGGRNSLRFLGVLVILCFAASKDFNTGLATTTLPIIFAGILVPYFTRDYLVSNIEVISKVMNILVVVAIVLLVIFGRFKEGEPDYVRVLLAFAFSSYIGVYFWMLSDGRVEIDHT
jgi:hypothetical protein